MKISALSRSAICDTLVDLVDGGAGAGTFGVRTGAAPTNTTDANSGTLLATIIFADPAFGSASAGVATASATTADSNVDATGTAAHWRIYDSNAVCIMQGTLTATGGGGDVTFNSTAFVSGGTANITSLAVTTPAGT